MSTRIALIGAEGYRSTKDNAKIECFPWDRVDRIKNLSDYHVVLINLLSLSDRSTVDWGAFSRALNLHSMIHVLQGEGRIIVIGDPRFSIPSTSAGDDGSESERPFLWWSGLTFKWDDRPGETKQRQFNEYEDRTAYGDYLSHLETWDYSLVDCSIDPKALAEVFRFPLADGLEFILQKEPFYSSRYNTTLAGAAYLCLAERRPLYGRHDPQYAPLKTFGALVLLPRTRLSEADSLVLLLRDSCGVELNTPEPAWVTQIVAPRQASIDEEIRRIEGELSELQYRLKSEMAAREKAREHLRLLYGQHADLEIAVREVLRELGAEVVVPRDPTKEDGWIRVRAGDGLLEGVLEIKGSTKSQFDETGLRQLHEWVGYGLDQQKDYKGIFVGNASVNKPPQDRPNPFGGNFVKRAEKQNFVLVKAEDLYAAYALKVLGQLDQEQFWLELFTTNGVFDVGLHRDALASTN